MTCALFVSVMRVLSTKGLCLVFDVVTSAVRMPVCIVSKLLEPYWVGLFFFFHWTKFRTLLCFWTRQIPSTGLERNCDSILHAYASVSYSGMEVLEPKVWTNGINKKFIIAMKKVEATLGWYFMCMKTPDTSSSQKYMIRWG